MKAKSTVFTGLNKMQSGKTYELAEGQKSDPTGLPIAPKSAFRKRPVKLTYEANDFHMFRMPSENDFLFSGMDKADIFGYRKGMQHSPYMQAQQNLDNNLLWALFGMTLFMIASVTKEKANFYPLRENFRYTDMGFFKEEDFN